MTTFAVILLVELTLWTTVLTAGLVGAGIQAAGRHIRHEQAVSAPLEMPSIEEWCGGDHPESEGDERCDGSGGVR